MSSSTKKPTPELTYFEKQRDSLISEISLSMDSILNNLNSLNRSVESTIQVGKEFKSVSHLWSNFYDGLNQIEELRQRNQQSNEDQQEGHEHQKEYVQEETEQKQNEGLGEELGSLEKEKQNANTEDATEKVNEDNLNVADADVEMGN